MGTHVPGTHTSRIPAWGSHVSGTPVSGADASEDV